MTFNWKRDAAAHLLRSAGFGGTPAEIDALAARGLDGAVSFLVDYDAIDTTAYEAALAAKNYNLATTRGLQQWFLDRMANSPRPLEEKMTYFWNLHWTSGISKVRGVTLMLNQNKTQRQYAVGKFDDLVVKMSQDPAMLVWLDNWLNKAAKPNENYARELMELYTLGIGNYTQADVTAVARALTGWTVQNYSQADNYNGATFVDNPAVHDNGSKTILGQTGNWNPTDAINILLTRTDARGSVSGRFIGAKLWRFFAYDDPPDFIVDQLAAVYVSSGRVDPRGAPRDLLEPRVLRAARAQDLGAQPRRVRRRVGPDARGHERLLLARGRARTHVAVSLRPGGRQGLGLGPRLDEHGHAVQPGDLHELSREQPRPDRHAVRSEQHPAGQGRFDRRQGRRHRGGPVECLGRLGVRATGLDRLHEHERRRAAGRVDEHGRERRQEGPGPRASHADEPGVPVRLTATRKGTP